MTLLATHYRRRAFLTALTFAVGGGPSSACNETARADIPTAPKTILAKADRSPVRPVSSPNLEPPTTTEEHDLGDALFALDFDTMEERTEGEKGRRGEGETQSPNYPTTQLPNTQRPTGRITIRKFQRVQWSPGGHTFHSQGSVQIVYNPKDPKDPKDTDATLTAQDVVGNSEDGQIEAKGGVRLQRADATLTGEQIKYNFNSRSGYITHAIVETAYFRMSGNRIETQADGAFVVQEGVFTTCLRGRPDYRIRARKLTVSPNHYVSARNITFYAGGTPLLSLPSYKRSLSTGSQVSTPLPGYNKSEGITLHLQDSPIVQPRQTFQYDLHLNFRRRPSGFLAYQLDMGRPAPDTLPPLGLHDILENPLRGYFERLNPPTYREYATNRYAEDLKPRSTFFATLQGDQFVYNRRRTDLFVSRLPELGVRLTNILGHFHPVPLTNPDGTTPEQPVPPVGSTESVLTHIPNAPFLLDISTSLGAFHESPTGLTTGRFALRADVSSQPIVFGKRLSWRIGGSGWFNLYGQGNAYALFSPEIELNYVPTRTSLFGIGYRYLTDIGTTPFAFDRRDLRHELRLRYQVGGPWAFGIISKIDMERSRAYDSELAILRNLDCMQIGLAYNARAQSFSIIFNLLPPAPDRERRMRTLPTNIGAFESLQALYTPKVPATSAHSTLSSK